MTPGISPYGGVVSARSRRLRTIGSLLLIAVVAMTAYGSLVLMPMVSRTVAAQRRLAISAAQAQPGPAPAPDTARRTAHARRLVRFELLFAYSYWTVCAALLVGLLFVAYLDFREISRNYLNQRLALWTDAADRARRDVADQNRPPDE